MKLNRPATLLIALVLLVVWTTPAGAQKRVNGPSADSDLQDLIRYGRMLSQCSLFDYASQMYDQAGALSQNISNQELRLLITAETAVYRFKNGGTAGGQALMESITSGLDWAKDPQTLCMAHLAIAYDAMSRKLWTVVDNEISLAFADADRSGLAQRQGDCFYAKGFGALAHGKHGDAVEAARGALQSYTRAHDYLSQSESHALLARYYRSQGNVAAAELETQKSLDTMDDISKGPIIDPNRTYGVIAAFEKGHIESAKQQEYEKAANQVLSLLILKRFQGKLKNTASDETLLLRDAELLAYLACYCIRQGDPLSGRVFLSFSDASMQSDLSPMNRARHRWLSGTFWRLAGSPGTALELLDKADQMLARLANPEPSLGEAVMEERGLALLATGKRDEASAAFEQALGLSQRSNLSEQTDRLKRYLKALAEGRTDLESLTPPTPAVATPITVVARPAKSTSDGIFDSPFADETGAPSAADAMMKLDMTRLEATPTPVNLSPDFLMRSQLYDQAAIKLEKIMKAEGETTERLMQLGICYFNTHDWAKAQDAFGRLLKLDPENGPAQEYLKGIKRQLALQPVPGT